MPSLLAPLIPQLPIELCDLVFAEVMEDGARDGERWLMKFSETDQPKMPTLRTLSQVNRTMRDTLMPVIWTDISLTVSDDELEKILGLRQLINDLKTSEGPMPGPKDYVQTMEFRIDIDCLWATERMSIFTTDNERLAHNARAYRCRRQLGFEEKNEEAVSLTVRKLSEHLIGCSQLTAIEWHGWIRPDPVVLVNLAQCKSIETLSVDLGHPEPWELQERWSPPKSTESDIDYLSSLPACARRFAFQSVHFAVEPRFTGCPSCDDPGPLDHNINPKEGEAGVALMTAFHFTRQMVIGAPLLLYHRWMLPLWAQLERLEFDPDYYEPGISRDEYITVEEPRDPEMDEEMMKAAQIFPHLLDRNRRIRRLLHSGRNDVDKIAAAVFHLIRVAPELANWAGWFPYWDDEPYGKYVWSSGFAHTKSIMRNVATVLLQRFALTKAKRKRYSTPAPEGYLRQTDPYWS